MPPPSHSFAFVWRAPARGAAGLMLLLVLLAGAAAAQPAAPASADVRLVVDVSASMGTTDPDNVRSRAVGLLLRLLPEDGRAGVWTYGRYVNMLVKYGGSDALWKETAAIQTADLESVGRRSNLLEAVERAAWDRNNPREGPVHLVLLADGHLDVSDDAAANAAERRRLLAELAPELAAAGFKVHTLALSERADTDLLRRLAATTGGYHGRIETPDRLPEGLVSLLGWLTPGNRLPVEEQGNFHVPPGVTELTVLSMRADAAKPLTLVSPSGERLDRHTPRDRVRWHLAPGYELATLSGPAAGVWRLQGGSGAQVHAYGDLAVQYQDFPGTLFPGDLHSFDFMLSSGGEPVTDADFLELLEVSATLRGPEAETPLVVEPATDGRYRVNLLGLQGRGEYVLETRVRGPTFSHSRSLPFVLDNPMTVEVRPVPDGFVLWVQVGAAALDHESLRMAAMVRRPPAPAKLMPLERLPTGLWKLIVPGAKGLVEVVLDFKGNYLNNRDFILRTQPIRVVLPVTAVQEVNLDLQGRPLLLRPTPRPAERSGPQAPGPAGPPAAAPAGVQAAHPVLPAEEGVRLPGLFVTAVSGINLLLAAGLWWLLAWPRRDPPTPSALAELRETIGFDAADESAAGTPATA